MDANQCGLVDLISVVLKILEVFNRKSKMVSARALHFVLKIGDRAANANFFRNILGMKVRKTGFFPIRILHFSSIQRNFYVFGTWMNETI